MDVFVFLLDVIQFRQVEFGKMEVDTVVLRVVVVIITILNITEVVKLDFFA